MSDVVTGQAPNEIFLTADQVAARYPSVPISRHGVYRMAREGKFKGVVTELGRYRVWRLDLLEKWEAAGGFGVQEESD